jgi:murein L,D-transpeptidase YafK
MAQVTQRWRTALASGALGVSGLVLWGLLAAQPAASLSIELKDVAADRVERQRRAVEGNLPLPGTPDLSRFTERLAEKGLRPGLPVLLRIFKAESELEVWMEKDGNYVLFATYPVCHWSGTLGPKLHQGDKQAPEGFYTVSRRQLHLAGRWPRSLNLGFPNLYDKSLARDGNYILVHGGCSSVGCYAMTNTVIEEIFTVTEAALREGEEHVPVHVFPFRMTAANMTAHDGAEWAGFWQNLREGYDSFERTGRPPHVSVCDGRYYFHDAAPKEGADPGPLGWCGATAAAISDLDRWLRAALLPPSHWRAPLLSRLTTARATLAALKSRVSALARPPEKALLAAMQADEPLGKRDLQRLLAEPLPRPPTAVRQSSCSPQLASCRKHLALEQAMAAKGVAQARAGSRRHIRTANGR